MYPGSRVCDLNMFGLNDRDLGIGSSGRPLIMRGNHSQEEV